MAAADVVSDVVSAYFAVVTAVIIATKAVPDLRQLLHYGKVSLLDGNVNWLARSRVARLVNALARITVPKAWFRHFYLVFAVLQWSQLLLAPELIWQPSKYLVVWVLLVIQATRRLVESFCLTKWGSSSRMHVSHYLVGIFYYVGVSLACWTGLQTQKSEARFGPLDLAVFVIFGVFSVDQFQNHRHLALLVKYSVPKFRLFGVVSCAHYLDEIVIYLSIVTEVLVHGGHGRLDMALMASWVFVVVNLSVSAIETHNYYQVKFDDYAVPYAVLPYLI